MRYKPVRRSNAVAAVVLTLAVLASGCGGGGNDAASTKTDAAPAAATGEGADKPTGGGGGGEYCKAVEAQLKHLSTTMDAYSKTVVAGSGSPDPALRQHFARAKELGANAAKVAPAQIRSDVQAQTRDASAMLDAYMASDPAAMTAVSTRQTSPEYLAAANRIAAYLKDHCGMDMTAPGGP